MITLQQLGKMCKGRSERKRKFRSRWLKGAPHKKAIITKISTMPPRKPNSAVRTYVRAELSVNKKIIAAKVPGIGEHGLQKHSVVMLRGHGPKDSPGLNYHLVRGCFDFIKIEPFGRRNRRSKFGLKFKDIIAHIEGKT